MNPRNHEWSVESIGAIISSGPDLTFGQGTTLAWKPDVRITITHGCGGQLSHRNGAWEHD